jgi:O-antigen polymerase
MDDTSKAEQIRAEAQFLFPDMDFSQVSYQPGINNNSTSSAQ